MLLRDDKPLQHPACLIALSSFIVARIKFPTFNSPSVAIFSRVPYNYVEILRCTCDHCNGFDGPRTFRQRRFSDRTLVRDWRRAHRAAARTLLSAFVRHGARSPLSRWRVPSVAREGTDFQAGRRGNVRGAVRG